jgi:3-dehydroquinate synthase
MNEINFDVPDSLKLNLGDRSYSLEFGSDLRTDVASFVRKLTESGRKVAVVTDRHVADSLGADLGSVFPGAVPLILPSGESTKSLENYGHVLDFLAASRLDRSGVVLALGGGVIGDLAGFAAASYLRGIDFVQVPTTLLAMVDSSVGGKTGINLESGKNLVGSFHQPRSVFISTHFLRTLPAREFAAGAAEVIKYGLISDAKLFAQLEARTLSPDHPELAAVIRCCCEIKARIVEADEFERAAEGGRALLNLGHTFGHAIERVTGYTKYLHGEAVAVGLCAAAQLSADVCGFPTNDAARVEKVLERHHLPVHLREPLKVGELLEAMAHDKKVRAGLPRFVLLRAVGEAITHDSVPATAVEKALRSVGAA